MLSSSCRSLARVPTLCCIVAFALVGGCADGDRDEAGSGPPAGPSLAGKVVETPLPSPIFDSSTGGDVDSESDREDTSGEPVAGGIDESPVEESLSERTPGEQSVEEQESDERTPDERTPDEQTPDEQMQDEQTPDERTPDEQTQDEQTPDERTLGEQTQDEQTPDEQTSDEQTSDGQTPGEQTPDEQTPGEQTSDEQVSDEQAPDEQTPNEQAQEESASGEQALDAQTLKEQEADEQVSNEQTPDERGTDGQAQGEDVSDGSSLVEEAPEEGASPTPSSELEAFGGEDIDDADSPARVVRIDVPAERDAVAGTMVRFPVEAFDGASSRPRLVLIDAPSDAQVRQISNGRHEFLWQTDGVDVGDTLVTIEAVSEDGLARASASVLLRVRAADSSGLEIESASENDGSDEGDGDDRLEPEDRETDGTETSGSGTAPELDDSSPLRELARELGLHIGFAAYHDLEGSLFTIPDADVYAALATTEYDILTPENSMKMSFIQPEHGRFDWEMADRVVDFAEGAGMAVHGHPLVWRQQNPAWVLALDKETRAVVMREHVAALVSRYRGRIAVWDVVNEALEDDGQLVHTTWYRALGEDYLAEAFRVAHEHDPEAMLIYNDYAINLSNPKSDALHALLERELARGTPIHGVGLQMHLTTDTTRFEAMRANLARFAALGLDIYLTEMDVATDWRADPAIEAERQANVYAEVLRLCLEASRCRAMQTWGLSDRHAWRGALSALPFDDRFAPKPAVRAMREVMMEFVESGARRRDTSPPR